MQAKKLLLQASFHSGFNKCLITNFTTIKNVTSNRGFQSIHYPYESWLFTFIMLFAFRVPRPIVLKLGNAACTIHVHKKGGNLATLIALHNNENTCIRAFNALPNSSPFVLYSISQKGNRLLEFKEKNKIYYLDPNRIFSRRGIIKTLKKYNTSYPKKL